MTCRDRLHRFVVEWRSQSTGRWRLEHSFWTREAAEAFLHVMLEHQWLYEPNSPYEWRARERKPRRTRTPN